jgi:hypothetical protein
MKKPFLFSLLLLTFSFNIFNNVLFAQKKDCPINIKVDVDLKANDTRIMRGVIVGTTIKTTKISAIFGKEYVEVSLPKNDKNVLLRIENSHCEGYCKRDKRVRQLTKRDANLLANIIKKQQASIFKQIDACN